MCCLFLTYMHCITRGIQGCSQGSQACCHQEEVEMCQFEQESYIEAFCCFSRRGYAITLSVMLMELLLTSSRGRVLDLPRPVTMFCLFATLFLSLGSWCPEAAQTLGVISFRPESKQVTDNPVLCQSSHTTHPCQHIVAGDRSAVEWCQDAISCRRCRLDPGTPHWHPFALPHSGGGERGSHKPEREPGSWEKFFLP
jgi:hypothetical protein